MPKLYHFSTKYPYFTKLNRGNTSVRYSGKSRSRKENTPWMLQQKQKLALQGCILYPTHCRRARKGKQKHQDVEICNGGNRKNLGNSSLVWRSQTTLFASTFHALMPLSAVPMRSFSQKNKKKLKNPYTQTQISRLWFQWWAINEWIMKI